jgi:hypothetical protein
MPRRLRADFMAVSAFNWDALLAMSTDPIRDLLASLPRASFSPCPPGHVAFVHARVEEAGGDHEAVAAWVVRVGGYVGTERIPGRGSQGGVTVEMLREAPGKVFYVVPEAALRE